MKWLIRKDSYFILVVLVTLSFWIGNVNAAITLTVTPASVPANTTTGFSLTTQANEAGGSVQIELYYDYNNNSTIDTDEWAIAVNVITDNVTEGDNSPFSNDSDPSNINITSVFNPFGATGGFLPEGNFIMKVQNSLGESATVNSTVTPASAPQTVSGTVYEQGTTTPVPYALVFCDDGTTRDTISATMTDGNGEYTLQIPSPGSFEITPEKQGYIGIGTSLSVSAAGVSNHNLYFMPSDAQVSGTVTEYGSGTPLSGVQVEAETIYDQESMSFTDINGTFSLPVTSGTEWKVQADEIPGYFGALASSHNYDMFPKIIPTVSGPNTVNFEIHKETAWIEVTVLDESGTQVVEGALFFVNRINTSDSALQRLTNGHYSNASGQVTVGVETGDWQVGLCMNCHQHPVLIGGVEKKLVPPPNADILNLAAGETRQVTLQTFYADVAVQGRVFREDGTTPVPAGVRVGASTDNALNGPSQIAVGGIYTETETDENGYYRLPLLGGTWTVRANMPEWNRQSGEQVVNPTTNGNDTIEPGETITGVDLVLNLPTNPPPVATNIEGHVYESDGATPISGATVIARTDCIGSRDAVVTSSDGYYKFESLPSGTYTVYAWAKDHVSRFQQITVDQIAVSKADFLLSEKTYTLLNTFKVQPISGQDGVGGIVFDPVREILVGGNAWHWSLFGYTLAGGSTNFGCVHYPGSELPGAPGAMTIGATGNIFYVDHENDLVELTWSCGTANQWNLTEKLGVNGSSGLAYHPISQTYFGIETTSVADHYPVWEFNTSDWTKSLAFYTPFDGWSISGMSYNPFNGNFLIGAIYGGETSAIFEVSPCGDIISSFDLNPLFSSIGHTIDVKGIDVVTSGLKAGSVFITNLTDLPEEREIAELTTTFDYTLKGDVNGNGVIDLEDLVICLKLLVGFSPDGINLIADVNNDSKIGLEEMIYIMQEVSGLR